VSVGDITLAAQAETLAYLPCPLPTKSVNLSCIDEPRQRR
jgi:hypothetical protein